MQIIHRYLVREIAQVMLVLCAILLMLYLSSRFVRYLAKAAEGVMGSEFIVSLLLLKLAVFLVLLLPLALYLAVILALGRMHEDSELQAMAACGIGRSALLRVVLGVAGAVALLTALLSMVVGPWANGHINQLEVQARERALVSSLVAGQFREFGKDRVIYSEGIADDGGYLQRLFIQLRHGESAEVLAAERGRYHVNSESNDQFLVLEDGRRYSGTPGRRDYTVTDYASYGVRVEHNSAAIDGRDPGVLPMSALWAAGTPGAQAELQWRLAMPLAAVLLAVLALRLSDVFQLYGRYARLVSAIGIYFIYNNSLGVSKNLLDRDLLPAWIGLWWAHLLLLVLVVAPWVWPRIRSWWMSVRKTPEAAA